MRKKIKIWFVSSPASGIRELSMPRWFFLLLAFVIVAAGIALTAAGLDYHRLKQLAFNNDLLSQRIAAQVVEIKNQRKQIQQFVSKINELNTSIARLSEFENRIRVVADLDSPDGSGGILGIGGVENQELEADLTLEQKHNSLIREMHRQIDFASTSAKLKEAHLEELLGMLEAKRNLLECTPSIRPEQGGWISSGFGYRTSPFTGKREFHKGLDIANRPGTKILATANGRVSYAKRQRLLGNLVIVDHGYGFVTKYGHLSEILVKPGDKVKRGDVIGLMGNTGRSTGNHVHYEVVVNGTSVNPRNYILN